MAEGRGVRLCQCWSRSERRGRSRQLPQHPHSRTPQPREAPTLLTQPTNIQNTRSGLNPATIHTTPATATFPPSRGGQLCRWGSKRSGAGRPGAQRQQGADCVPPKPEVFQNVLASFLPCLTICKEVTQELQGLRSSRPGLHPHRVFSASPGQAVPAGRLASAPRCCSLLLSQQEQRLAAKNQHSATSKTSPKLPNAQKMTA